MLIRCEPLPLPQAELTHVSFFDFQFQGVVVWVWFACEAFRSSGEADEPMVAVGTELEQLKNGVRSSGFSIVIDNDCLWRNRIE